MSILEQSILLFRILNANKVSDLTLANSKQLNNLYVNEKSWSVKQAGFPVLNAVYLRYKVFNDLVYLF